LMRKQAFAIRGLPAPAIPAPAPPKLLPIADAGAISWQGSVGATGYAVERAARPNGPWTVVGENVDESFTQYRPQFSDETVTKGKWFYRVRAKNAAGVSAPSNVIGPVRVAQVTCVDELADFTKVHSHAGELGIESRDCRSAMEDAHRAGGRAGSALVYRMASPITAARVFVFFPKEIADVKFSVSADGLAFQPAATQRNELPFNLGDYGYWRRAIYEVKPASKKDEFLKIEFTGAAQISRVEIQRAADAK
jgi:mannan endo-1,4-beta-mannosidase